MPATPDAVREAPSRGPLRLPGAAEPSGSGSAGGSSGPIGAAGRPTADNTDRERQPLCRSRLEAT